MVTIIEVGTQHNHPLNSAETLRYLKPISDGLRKTFIEYFESGLGSCEACRKHVETLDSDEKEYASGRSNPHYRVVQNWFDKWRMEKFGPTTGEVLFQVFQH